MKSESGQHELDTNEEFKEDSDGDEDYEGDDKSSYVEVGPKF